jgi:membrane associated rhomboid family serine protease
MVHLVASLGYLLAHLLLLSGVSAFHSNLHIAPRTVTNHFQRSSDTSTSPQLYGRDDNGFSTSRVKQRHWLSTLPPPQKKKPTALQSQSAEHFPSQSSRGLVLGQLPGLYGLMLLQIGVFLIDNVFQNPLVKKSLYLWHGATRGFQLWQPLTACFCHLDRIHLGTNLFLLLIMGRSVEAEFGNKGLWTSFAICGVISSVVSLFLIPGRTISIGASGAILGLFLMSALNQVWHLFQSRTNILSHWRMILEVLLMGEFVIRQFITEVSTSAFGAKRTINVVGHLAGALAGAVVSRWVLTKGMQDHPMQLPDFGGRVVVPEIIPTKMRPRPDHGNSNLVQQEMRRTSNGSNSNLAQDQEWSNGPWSGGLRQSSSERRPRTNGQRFSNEDAWSHGQRKFGGDDSKVYRNGQEVHAHFSKGPSFDNTHGQPKFGGDDTKVYRNGQQVHAHFSKGPSGNTKVSINGVEVAASVSPEGRVNYGMDTGIKVEPERHWWQNDLGGDYEDFV